MIIKKYIIYLAVIFLSMQLYCERFAPLLIPATEASCEPCPPFWELNPFERTAHSNISRSGILFTQGWGDEIQTAPAF